MVLRWNVAEKRREVGEAQCVGKQGASEQPVRISWMGWLAGPALSQKISRYSACPRTKNQLLQYQPAKITHPNGLLDLKTC